MLILLHQEKKKGNLPFKTLFTQRMAKLRVLETARETILTHLDKSTLQGATLRRNPCLILPLII